MSPKAFSDAGTQGRRDTDTKDQKSAMGQMVSGRMNKIGGGLGNPAGVWLSEVPLVFKSCASVGVNRADPDL